MSSSPGRAYTRGIIAAGASYAIILIIAILILNNAPAAPWSFLIATLPVLPIAYGVLVYRRFLREIDELQQRIQLDALAFAVGGTGLICTAWGFLELAGLPSLPAIWVFPLIIWLWGLGLAIASRRYQ